MSPLNTFMMQLLEEQRARGALDEQEKELSPCASNSHADDESDQHESPSSSQMSLDLEGLSVTITDDNARIHSSTPVGPSSPATFHSAFHYDQPRSQRNTTTIAIPKWCPNRWDSASASAPPAPSRPVRMLSNDSYTTSPITAFPQRKHPGTQQLVSSTKNVSPPQDTVQRGFQRIMIV